MEKLTIHRALSELKLIGAKIEKQTNELVPSGIVQKDKLVDGVYQKDDFENTARSRYQAVNDLINRRNKIKASIVKANGETKVKVAGEEMTIADAITLKGTIDSRKKVVDVLRRKHNATKAALEKNNAQVDANALGLSQMALGKQGVKLGPDEIKNAVGPYLESNTFHLVDPLFVEKEIVDLEKKIGDFEAEVDAVLSEANAITIIEI